jgi:hypothetical protein
LRLEKPHEPSTSGDPPGDFRERRGPKPTRRAAFHFETVNAAACNGPALGTAFAAQVIAQALNIHDTSAGAARCYPAPGLRPALLLDCSV